MITDPIGLYIHIPYCVRKCHYCDFCSLPIGADAVPDFYIERLIDELSSYAEHGKIPVSTVYLGGGTPSLLTPEQMGKITSAAKYHFEFAENIEFTIEANPGTVTEDKLKEYRTLGVNRISLGLQSVHDTELSSLGRIHNFDEFLSSYNTARRCGFDNVSVDLMYGLPGQTLTSFTETLRSVIDLAPEHISVYGLILEEGTRFWQIKDRLPLPNEGTECDMYYLAAGLLREAGYSHYEISNYAKPGFESKHNLKYWRAESYIGVGASAASYFLGKRYVNTHSVGAYISGKGLQYGTEEIPDRAGLMFEYAMMRLRLAEGISFSEYKSRFDTDFLLGKKAIVNKLADCGLVSLSNDRLSLTERGFYVSNAILTEIL